MIDPKLQRILVALSFATLFLGLSLVPGWRLHQPVRAASSGRSLQAPGDCVVTTSNDSGAGSFRACISGLQSGATITFDPAAFPPANPATISLLTALPVMITGSVTIDGSNAGVILSRAGLSQAFDGLVIDGADQVVIKGLDIRDFPGRGIILQNGASNNTIGGSNGLGNNECSADCNVVRDNLSGGVQIVDPGTTANVLINNHIGVDAAGTSAAANDDFGIEIANGAQANVITGNLISGNLGPGVSILGSNTLSNTVANNRLGTNRSGTADIRNLRGVLVEGGARFNLIDQNLISGNSFEGVRIAGTGTSGNTISRNRIGTNKAGAVAIENQIGLALDTGAQSNTITANLISGNLNYGVRIGGSGTTDNLITGNEIGTNQADTAALPNINGISIEAGANTNTVGENRISGNNLHGLLIQSTANTVRGNFIGTNRAGTAALANGFGLELSAGAQANVITANLISGNILPGITIKDSGTSGNIIAQNLIGSDISGQVDLGNRFGALIYNGAQFNLIERNTIGFNKRSGVAIFGVNTFGNTIRQNSIFSNADKGIALLNGGNRGLIPPGLLNVGANSVSGVALPGSTVEIFSDDDFQGQFFHGSVVADANGQFTFTQVDPFAGANVTATATDGEGNTSEFSGFGAGVFELTDQVFDLANSQATALGDLNLDGRIDALVVNDINLQIWLNDGTGAFTLNQTLNSTDAQAVALGDLDQDGNIDAVVGRNGADQIWLNDGAGNFSLGSTFGSSDTQAVVLGDLDGDSRPDVITGHQGPDQVWLNDGAGGFNLGTPLGSSDTQSVALGDLDGNSTLDAITGSDGGQPNQVWLNDGAGGLSLGNTFGSSDSESVALGDLNLDGSLDIFVGNNGADQIWLNTGSGAFNLGQTLTDTFDSQAVALGDLNNDGHLDAFIGNGSNQGNQVWLNNGTGSFGLGQNLAGSDSQAVGLGDLDSDNDLDTFVANGSTQLNQVLFNQNRVILRTGPQGGTLTAVSAEGLTTTITIPAGVLDQNTTLTYLPLDGTTHPISATLRSAQRTFSLIAEQGGSPVSNPFAGAIQFTIYYDPGQLNADELLLYYWDLILMQWVDAATTCNPTSTYLRGTHFVGLSVCHLTEFSLLGPGRGHYLPIILKQN